MKSNEAKKVNYLLIGHIETRFGDPITSISLNSRYCIIGTMFGKLILYTIKIKEATIILEH